MATPPIYRQPLDGSEMVRVLKDGRFYMAPVTAVLDLLGLPATLAPLTARLSAAETALAAQAARLAILEARPEEVAHFTGSAKFPTVAVGARFTLELTGVSPVRAGDVIRAGEQVAAWPTGSVPAGITFGQPVAAADNTVTIPCAAGLAIAASSTAVPFALAALRWGLSAGSRRCGAHARPRRAPPPGGHRWQQPAPRPAAWRRSAPREKRAPRPRERRPLARLPQPATEPPRPASYSASAPPNLGRKPAVRRRVPAHTPTRFRSEARAPVQRDHRSAED